MTFEIGTLLKYNRGSGICGIYLGGYRIRYSDCEQSGHFHVDYNSELEMCHDWSRV